MAARVLAVNAGSSSIKVAAFEVEDTGVRRVLDGRVEGVGSAGATLALGTSRDESARPVPLAAKNHAEAGERLMEALAGRGALDALAGVGHRVVQSGFRPRDHQRVTPELVAQLRAVERLDLDHLPAEIHLIEAFQRRLPEVPQVACFDTAFHRGLPRVAQLLPIPRRYDAAGVRRLGFHGLSFAYLLEELERTAGAAAARGRVILAHLGAGASLAAVRDGKPVDTTMAFTPTAGLVMATRPGDLDPGVLVHVSRRERMSADQLDDFISRRCGLLGVAEETGDMRELLGRREADPRAAEAVALFCYQVRKWLGAFAAALGGLDTLVFAGGIGEHAPAVRAESVEGLSFLGLTLDPGRNTADAPVISSTESRVAVRVIRTDEELMIARYVTRILAASGSGHGSRRSGRSASS